ncbi:MULTISPECIES: TonB-dependent receptor domain-containing protein [unclassified Haematobacter]|uniref:TonB-dependent receptor domain-containing protein n=1 Tax=unclassified Haematobacter TaxID=2640585 RepID=UPI0025B88E6D|nr:MULTISPECIES: TonB-dependent receptor [unclassified Haematobacter]
MRVLPRRLRRDLMMSVAAAALLALPAAAQDAAEVTRTGEPATVLNRIVLGAGQPRVATDTPQAVTVIDQQDLDSEQASSIDQIFANVPGVQGAGADNPLGFAFNIRGIGGTETTASESRIIVNVDGVPKFYEQYRMGSFFSDVELYKQVEVLRGPASSTLYGSGAIGGVVNFTTKDASDFLTDGNTHALRFKGSYDSNGSGWLGSVIYAQKYDERFEVIGNLNYRTMDEYKDGNGDRVKGSDAEAWSGLVKGTYHFGQDLDQSVRLSYQRTQSDMNESPLVRTGGGAPIIDTFGYINRDVTDDTIVAEYANPFVDNAWLDLRVQLSYSKTQVKQSDHVDTSGGFVMCMPGTLAVVCDSEYAYETTLAKVENVSEFAFGDWQNYLTTGLQFTHQNRVATSAVGALNFHPEGTDDKIGVYAQAEFNWRERLSIIPGIRVDFGERSPGSGIPGAEDVSDTAVSPKIAALYKLTDAWGIFASYARTERMPTLDELYAHDARRVPSLDLAKEKADTVEVGVSYSAHGLLDADDSLALKGTLFHNDIENLIASNTGYQPVNGAVPRYLNIDNAEIWGGELEGAYSADRWFGRLAYSQVKGVNKDTRETLSTVPAEQVSLTLGGRLPERNLEYGWRATYVDSIRTTLGHFSAYDVHRLFVSWKPDTGALAGFTVDFAVDNVFDEDYRNNLYQDNGRGRTFKLSMTKQFDW